MRTFTKKELSEILSLHKKWLADEEGGVRADLSYSDLSYSDLSYSDLSGSDLSGSDLSGSDLRCSDLSGSDLSGSDLSYSDLSGSNLSGSDLSGSDLSGSDLRCSDLSGSDLSGSNLRFIRSANGKELACMNAGKYQVVISKEMIAIGCKFYTVEEWRQFDDITIGKMDDRALEWWRQWKELVFMFHSNVFGGSNE